MTKPSRYAAQLDELTLNILSVYYEATDYVTVMVIGRDWYWQAHYRCIDISMKYQVDLDLVVGVVAALSPNNRWERNLLDAEACIMAVQAADGDDSIKTIANNFTALTYEANKVKAVKIAIGHHPDTVLGGNKVRSFWSNIRYPGSSLGVTIDGHAIAIALGERQTLAKAPKLSDKDYAVFVEAYTRAAFTVNSNNTEDRVVSPMQMQAICWVMWRCKYGIDKTTLTLTIT